MKIRKLGQHGGGVEEINKKQFLSHFHNKICEINNNHGQKLVQHILFETLSFQAENKKRFILIQSLTLKL